MIGKIRGHNSVKNAIEYNLKHESELIGTHNMTAESPKEIIEEMLLVQQLFNGRATQKTMHIILSPTMEDGKRLTNEQWQDIANSYLRKMDMEERQSAVFLHEDKGHTHLHLVVNSIDSEGKIWRAKDINGKNVDRVKLTEKTANEIVREMGLTSVQEVQLKGKAKEPSEKIITEPKGSKQEIEKVLQQASLTAWHTGKFEQGKYLEAIRKGLEMEGKGRVLQTSHVDRDPAKAIRGFEIIMEDGKRLSASTIGREYTLQQQAKSPLIVQWTKQAAVHKPSIERTERKRVYPSPRPALGAGNTGHIKWILSQSGHEALTQPNGKNFKERFEQLATAKLREQGYEFHPYRKDKSDPSKLTGYGVKYMENGQQKYTSATALGREYTLPRLATANEPRNEIVAKPSTLEEERSKLNKEVRQTINEIIKDGDRANSLVERLQAKGYDVTEVYDTNGNVTDYKIKTKDFVGLTGAQLSPDLRDNNIEMTIALTYKHKTENNIPNAYIQNFQNQGYAVALSKGIGQELQGYELTRGGDKLYIPLTQAVYQERQLSQQQREEIEQQRIRIELLAQEKKRKEKQDIQQAKEFSPIKQVNTHEPMLTVKQYDKTTGQNKVIEVPVRIQQVMAHDLSQLRYENPVQWKAAIEAIKDRQGKQKYSVDMNQEKTNYALTDITEGHRLTATQVGKQWSIAQLEIHRNAIEPKQKKNVIPIPDTKGQPAERVNTPEAMLQLKQYDKTTGQNKVIEVPVRIQQVTAHDLSQLRYENPVQWKAAIEAIKDGQGKQKYNVEMNQEKTNYALTNITEGHRLTATQVGKQWTIGQLETSLEETQDRKQRNQIRF